MSGLPPDAPRDPAPPPTAGSYSERYAGTPWGSANAPPEPPKVAPPPSGFSCLRVFVLLVGIFWLLPALVGIVLAVAAGSTGQIEGLHLTDAGRAGLLIGVGINLLWVVFGIRLILAPSRGTLRTSALVSFIYAVAAAGVLALLVQSQQSTLLVEVIVGVVLAIYILVMMISLVARDAWE